jgi:Ca2+-binding RTX toxin-like protein
MALGRDGTQESFKWKIANADVGPGQMTLLKVDPSTGQLIFSNAQAAGGSYNLEIIRLHSAGEEKFLHSGVAISAAGTHYVDYGTWDGSGSMTLGIDRDSDGAIDEAIALTNEEKPPAPDDLDNDGIPDEDDNCPNSNLNDTVTIDGCNANVPNTLFPDGCTISDLIAQCAADSTNPAKLVSCVASLMNDLKQDGVITGRQMGDILSCAAGQRCNCNAPGAIRGDEGPDYLKGTPGDDIICGRGGDDLIEGRGGNDCLDGGAGGDDIRGSKGDDLIFGRGSSDLINGGPGNDSIRGGRGHDEINGRRGDDWIDGGKGKDRIWGGGGNDLIDGGDNVDLTDGGFGQDECLNVETAIGCEW